MAVIGAGDSLVGRISYRLLTDLSVKDAGTSRWAFAQGDGEHFFIKEHTSPKWPSDAGPGSDAVKEKRRAECRDFEVRKSDLHTAINSVGKVGGTIVPITDFFQSGPFYYTVAPRIDVASLPIDRVARLSLNERLVILASASNALGAFHSTGAVHSDIKPENILIKRTELAYTSRLIDFDEAYLAKNPPPSDEIGGSPEYFSPELLSYVKSGSGAGELSQASDVFALGLVFIEYLTGRRVVYGDYASPAHAALEGQELCVPTVDGLEHGDSLDSMLSVRPADRPSMHQVHQAIKDMRVGRRPILGRKPDEPKRTTRAEPEAPVDRATSDGPSRRGLKMPRRHSTEPGSPAPRPDTKKASPSSPGLKLPKRLR